MGANESTEARFEEAMREALGRFDADALEERFHEQNGLLVLEDFLPKALLEELLGLYEGDLASRIHRNYVPRQKKGGSVSRHILDRRAPAFPALYRSPAFRAFLETITGETLLDCPDGDPHAYALYCYTEPGDHIGWHFDTSFYKGKRFTILLGLIENESCRLDCELFKKVERRPTESRSITIQPGTLVFFDGDNLWHRVSPMAEGDGPRVVLTMELLTDTAMNPFRRLVSNVKDAAAYFGFKEVFFGPRRGAADA